MRRKSAAYSKITWHVNVPQRLSVIKEESRLPHPPPHALRYFLQEKTEREDELGRYHSKISACPKITWQENLPRRLGAFKKPMERHSALPKPLLYDTNVLSHLWKPKPLMFCGVCTVYEKNILKNFDLRNDDYRTSCQFQSKLTYHNGSKL